MTSNQSPATATAATQALESLPPLAGLGISFTALGPDQAGVYRGHAINISSHAAADLAEIAEATRARVLASTLLGYGPAVLIPPSHVMHVEQQSAATLDEIQRCVDTADLDAFDPGAAYAKDIKMVAARFLSVDGGEVTFYRVADTLLQFKKSRLLSLVRVNGQYDRLDAADLLLMRPEFDVVVLLGQAFFFLKATFERAFGFLDQLRATSAATFDSVTKDLRIDGMQELRKACTSQPQMMAKMASIRRSMDEDPSYAAAMTMPRLLAYVAANPAVNIEISGTGDDRALVFNPAIATRFQLVKLLDDDYLHSVLTDRDYEAGSKVRATPPP